MAYDLLRSPIVYSSFQSAVGTGRMYRLLADRCVEARPGMSIVDVGAGTGAMRELLADCEYTAIEPNSGYAADMRRRFADDPDVTVVEGTLDALADIPSGVDRVVFGGLTHHLSDEVASRGFELGARALGPNGRLVTFDPCIHPSQSRASRFLVGHDRGANVRHPEEYAGLATPYFSRVRLAVTDGVLRIPSSHAWLVCEGPRRTPPNGIDDHQ